MELNKTDYVTQDKKFEEALSLSNSRADSRILERYKLQEKVTKLIEFMTDYVPEEVEEAALDKHLQWKFNSKQLFELENCVIQERNVEQEIKALKIKEECLSTAAERLRKMV